MSGLSRLFSEITGHSVWLKPNHVRVVWIALHAMADGNGIIRTTIPSLASRSRVSIPMAQDAIQELLAGDEFDGPMAEQIEGGWRLLGYKHFKALESKERLRESKRAHMERKRAKEKKADKPEAKKSKSWKDFFLTYPENKKGGTDASAWEAAKREGLTDSDFEDMILDVADRKAFCPSWYSTYAPGITKYIKDRIWKTPIRRESVAPTIQDQLTDRSWAGIEDSVVSTQRIER